VNQSVVYLKDVSSRQLEMLLSYMYRGEINVEEGDLVKLLQTAKGLGIKGLSEVDDQNAVNLGKKCAPVQPKTESLSKKRPRTEEFQGLNVKQVQVYEDVIEVAPPKEIEYDNIAEDSVEVVEPTIETMTSNSMEINEDGAWYGDEEDGEGEEFAEYDEQDRFDQGNPNYLGGARKSDVPEPPLNCPQCPKTFASTWHLKRHVATHTKDKKFKCDLCGKFFSRNDNLKSHQKSVHGVVNHLQAPGASSDTHLLDY